MTRALAPESARYFLVAYDVASPKRWRRVVKVVKKHGVRQQLSVFLCHMTRGQRDRLEAALRRELNAGQDRLLIADLGGRADAIDRLGLHAAELDGETSLIL